jgi:bacterioferritin-associated ferredoxin
VIVCVCRAVNDRTLEQALETGSARSVKDLARVTGAGTVCGNCRCDLKQMVEERRSGATSCSRAA